MSGPLRPRAMWPLLGVLASTLLLGLDDRARGGTEQAQALEREQGELPQAAYVWQRAWSEGSVARALAEQGPAFERVLVLAAELELRDEPRVVKVAWDPQALADVDELGLVIRVGPCSELDSIRDLLITTALEQLARARAAGLAPVELQIDFDAASSQLAGYRRWLVALREALVAAGFTPELTITGLPDWLTRAELPALLEVCDGWVLQVHGLAPPQPGQPRSLFDAERAHQWIEQAGALGHRFRVALPSYHYLVAREPGAGASVAAESTTALALDRFDRVGPDVDELAGLVAALSEDRPAALDGLIWFRMPVAGDRLALSWPALRALMQGRPPTRALDLRTCASEGGLVELSLHNRGELDRWTSELEPLELRWADDAELLVGDALAGFRLERGDHELRLIPEQHLRITGDHTQAIAWLRFRGEPSLEFHSSAQAALDLDPTCTTDPP